MIALPQTPASFITISVRKKNSRIIDLLNNSISLITVSYHYKFILMINDDIRKYNLQVEKVDEVRAAKLLQYINRRP